jgi:hypothetical protein
MYGSNPSKVAVMVWFYIWILVGETEEGWNSDDISVNMAKDELAIFIVFRGSN